MPKIEICVDNVESVITANQLPIDRIELCSALALGGLSVNYGLLKQAVRISTVPLAVMVRGRAGDFIFSESEVQAMLAEIELVKSLGVQHIVIGALTPAGDIDLPTTTRFIQQADGMQVTFHRAFDLCRNPHIALEQLIDLGCHRILTSGQAKTAFDGIAMLQSLVQQADNRIQIMAGCGVNPHNVQAILHQTCVPEIHFSAKGFRISEMQTNSPAAMGNNGEQDRRIDVLDANLAQQILDKIGEVQ
ncbi:copper homeostasis protein CutC [Frederiksenia canicola]|uniref:PF03932 family protein CutC n=1 Tax=Frederiksenia canicola TaxID=123824 RepID=A0AAE6X7D1_9PAST|nr:copper homeostasis protein CutC [Frederiksenia canicola]QIM65437.1 copper homeostasis protein CutC [Frederiksenia canicola]RPE96119.1 copper homeostasis protein [Frederiksenia canicola]